MDAQEIGLGTRLAQIEEVLGRLRVKECLKTALDKNASAAKRLAAIRELREVQRRIEEAQTVSDAEHAVVFLPCNGRGPEVGGHKWPWGVTLTVQDAETD